MKRLEVTDEELALMLQALEDAAFYRDARSRVLERAARRRDRGLMPAQPDQSGHPERARAYLELAIKLKKARQA